MDVVGSFLNNLFSESGILDCSLPMQPSKVSTPLEQTLFSSSQISSTFHSAPGYSQEKIIRLVLKIYGGSPEAFQVLRCTAMTTEQDLRLFMKRVIQHPMCQYLILEVNILPFQLQEVCFSLIISVYILLNNLQCCLFLDSAATLFGTETGTF